MRTHAYSPPPLSCRTFIPPFQYSLHFIIVLNTFNSCILANINIYHLNFPPFLLRQERSSRSKYWQHVDGFYNPDVTRRFDLSHLPPIYVHIIYERQLLQGLTLAIVNYTPASRCVYIFRLMWYICVGCASPYKNMLFLMYFNAFSRRYHGWGMRECMSADTICVNNSYSARPWFTDVNQITQCFPYHFIY